MKALILGANGQTASYIAEHLLKDGYEVHGLIRRNSISEHQETRIKGLDIETYYGDVCDTTSLDLVFRIKPDLVFNTAAQSHVRVSYDIPQATVQTNANGVLNVLEAYRTHCPDAKFIQCSSSEMFGNSVDPDGFQRETTPMHPVSPYGCAKLFGYAITRNYRHAYGLHACNSICFNHESPRRAANFVTNKIIKAAVAIKKGHQKTLELGNLDSFRDWGHASDYARAIIAIVNHSVPSDWVVATGETHSVRELCEIVFSKLGMDYREYVTQNPKYIRPEELKYLRGDSRQIRTVLGWKPEYTFEQLITEMIAAWL